MPTISNIAQALTCLASGGVIGYPTEGVYGLGCDPFNEKAVMQLLALKQRPWQKGLILLVSDWDQVHQLIAPIDEALLAPVRESWPGAVTWCFPKSAQVPSWISGVHETIALRMSAHPIATELCEQFAKPLVSTSANVSDEVSMRDGESVQRAFGDRLCCVVNGAIGELAGPTPIYDVMTGEVIRS